ncbi:M61 family metallopeptidase [Rheinheimera fenheensis]|uniref:M61 family metallopeptidase n=1 Tax=Rheinheimera fenheensis TaxID=3152295 RepID=UPI00325DAD63
MKSVKYQFELVDITAHMLRVTLQFSPKQPSTVLTLPAWIPGSYMIRDFARNITAIRAFDACGAVKLTQLDKQRWQLEGNSNVVTVEYYVYAYDLSVRAAYIDDEVAILNPACLCLAVEGQQALPHQLNLVKPAIPACKDWRVATALPHHSTTKALGFGRYQAANYDELIDRPLLLGRFSISQFSIDEVPHYVVVSGSNRTDLTRFTDDLAKICQQQKAVFGELPDDLTQYWFLLWVTEDGYGGLEHKDSTLLLCSRFDLPAPGATEIDDNYQNLLALCSHEYFHTWWVKRLKPACFHPYQLHAEQYTSQLWLYEGFTSYFDDLALVKAGLIPTERYINTLEKTISRVNRNPSDSVQSLLDSSFTAWTKFYKQDENAPNAVVSYYAKGALLALCLEAQLHANGSSLQQLVRWLWQHYLSTGTADNAVECSLTQMGFAEIASLLTQWLSQAAPLPLQQTLPALGLELVYRPMQHMDDNGGSSNNCGNNSIFIGAQTKVVNGLLQLSQVYQGGNVHNAGLMAGDQLLAIDGIKVSANNLSKLLSRYNVGDQLKVHFYRKDRLLSANLTLNTATQQVAVLTIKDVLLCNAWLATRD